MAEFMGKIDRMPRGAVLRVKISGSLAFRLWLGTTLIKLAAWVMQCEVEIEGPN